MSQGLPLYYTLQPGTSVNSVLHSWRIHGSKAYDNSMPIWYSAEDLWKWREFTRTRGGDDWMSVEDWDALVASLKAKGWSVNDPLIMEVGRDGKAKVAEGNHRLAIARQLKIAVPVRFLFEPKVVKTRLARERAARKAAQATAPTGAVATALEEGIMGMLGVRKQNPAPAHMKRTVPSSAVLAALHSGLNTDVQVARALVPDPAFLDATLASVKKKLADLKKANFVEKIGKVWRLTTAGKVYAFARRANPSAPGRVSVATAKRIGARLGVDWTKVQLDEFRRGLEVEQEHWRTIAAAKGKQSLSVVGRIALDHLAEMKDYYTRLDRMERKRNPADVLEELQSAALDVQGQIPADTEAWGHLECAVSCETLEDCRANLQAAAACSPKVRRALARILADR